MKRRVWLVVAHVVFLTLAIICVVVFGQFGTTPLPTLRAVHDCTDVYYLLVDEDGDNRVETIERYVANIHADVEAVNSNLQMLMDYVFDRGGT